MPTSSIILLTFAAIYGYVGSRCEPGTIARRNYLWIAACFTTIVVLLQAWMWLA